MPESKIKTREKQNVQGGGNRVITAGAKRTGQAKRNGNGENGNGRTDGGNDTHRNVRIRMKNKESSGNR